MVILEKEEKKYLTINKQNQNQFHV